MVSEDVVDLVFENNITNFDHVHLHFNPTSPMNDMKKLLLARDESEALLHDSPFGMKKSASCIEDRTAIPHMKTMQDIALVTDPKSYFYHAKSAPAPLCTHEGAEEDFEDFPPPPLSLHRSDTILPSDAHKRPSMGTVPLVLKRSSHMENVTFSMEERGLEPYDPSPAMSMSYEEISTPSDLPYYGSIETFYSSVYSRHISIQRYHDVISATSSMTEKLSSSISC
jgi:hypothetical protein